MDKRFHGEERSGTSFRSPAAAGTFIQRVGGIDHRAYSESRLTARQRAWQRARTTSGEENAGTSQLVDEQTQKRNSVVWIINASRFP
ncbi:hypothetical protein K0M31_004527 [Melipona bicolor]|uniref:Uncharacterized protein n=1 Tax=Melipona bicolor TaxID=60889 RepID=A0AA40KNK7_9HYME|nr:hypothetical protein K0M31_004527 [Melipona bicolor]